MPNCYLHYKALRFILPRVTKYLFLIEIVM
jgi:hypothetical protein